MFFLSKKMVGETGFEPAASTSQTWRSTKLSYSPVNGRTGWFCPNDLSVINRTLC